MMPRSRSGGRAGDIGWQRMSILDWNTLRQVAAQGYNDGIVCLATIAVVERANRTEVIAPLEDEEAGRAAKLLIDSALFRLQMFVVRAFGIVRKNDRHLRAAIEFLERPGRLDEERWPERRVDLEEAIRLFNEVASDPALDRLKHLRDKQLAHFSEMNPQFPLPTYNDLFGVTRKTAEVWERLSFGAGTVLVKLDHQIDAYRESAEAFWGRWDGGELSR